MTAIGGSESYLLTVVEKYETSGDVYSDYRYFCTVLNIQLHPGIVYRTVDISNPTCNIIEIRGWKIDYGTIKALSLTLRKATTVTTLR